MQTDAGKHTIGDFWLYSLINLLLISLSVFPFTFKISRLEVANSAALEQVGWWQFHGTCGEWSLIGGMFRFI
jgi:hypothetical protein